jgi:hypothetical protein
MHSTLHSLINGQRCTLCPKPNPIILLLIKCYSWSTNQCLYFVNSRLQHKQMNCLTICVEEFLLMDSIRPYFADGPTQQRYPTVYRERQSWLYQQQRVIHINTNPLWTWTNPSAWAAAYLFLLQIKLNPSTPHRPYHGWSPAGTTLKPYGPLNWIPSTHIQLPIDLLINIETIDSSLRDVVITPPFFVFANLQ